MKFHIKKGADLLKWQKLVSLLVSVALIFLMAYDLNRLDLTQENHHSNTIDEQQVEIPDLTIPIAVTETAQSAGVQDAIETEPEIEEEKPLEQQIFELVYERSSSEYIAAAFVGNAKYESRMISYRWEGDVYPDENGIYTISRKATDQINELLHEGKFEEAKKKFLKMNPMGNYSGFGLYMFTHIGIKEMLIDFAISIGKDIDDPIMQTEFVLYYIQQNSNGLWGRLISDDNVKDCTERFAGGFEKCIRSETGYYARNKYAKEIYELYSEKEKVE